MVTIIKQKTDAFVKRKWDHGEYLSILLKNKLLHPQNSSFAFILGYRKTLRLHDRRQKHESVTVILRKNGENLILCETERVSVIRVLSLLTRHILSSDKTVNLYTTDGYGEIDCAPYGITPLIREKQKEHTNRGLDKKTA